MRKTLFAMLGLVALGLWAMPALAAVSNDPAAKAPAKVSEPISLENRAGVWQTRTGGYQGSLSGSVIHQAQATTTWYLYPGACAERAGGTWTPRTTAQADSLNSYTPGSIGPYGVTDQSVSEILWHVSNDATCTLNVTCPPAIAGTHMLWCGKFDGNWSNKVGYPNATFQILYINTGAHAINYNLTLDYQFSTEFGYDFVWLIGGGGGGTDPIGNSRATLDGIIAAGGYLVQWTGSIRPTTAGATGGNTTAGAINISENPGSPATVTGAVFTIDPSNRALYLVFKSDCFNSSEDGLWPEGHGQMVDNLTAGTVSYTEEDAPINPIGGGALPDSTVPPGGGIVIKGTATAPTISARVAPGVGTLWQLVAGSSLPT